MRLVASPIVNSLRVSNKFAFPSLLSPVSLDSCPSPYLHCAQFFIFGGQEVPLSLIFIDKDNLRVEHNTSRFWCHSEEGLRCPVFTHSFLLFVSGRAKMTHF